jgi:hypothetical protein
MENCKAAVSHGAHTRGTMFVTSAGMFARRDGSSPVSRPSIEQALTGLPTGQARRSAVLVKPRSGRGGATAADLDVVDIENLDDRSRGECIAACCKLQFPSDFLRS